jgi:hypothetical protein
MNPQVTPLEPSLCHIFLSVPVLPRFAAFPMLFLLFPCTYSLGASRCLPLYGYIYLHFNSLQF